ncbi:MAG: hypothetical protein Q8R07_00790, partial [Candidatus Uhrbacteria bacterium]|nr:hypothetical protein [Candidatus Uhrbacteria bacterium]
KKLDKAALAAAVLKSGALEYSGSLGDITGGAPVQGTTTTEGFANGMVQAMFSKAIYRLEAVVKNLPDPAGTDFYEGWLVHTEAPFDFISTGKFNKTDEAYVNKYSSGNDLTDHLFYVVTLESDDKNPAPSAHVLEGRLSKLSGAASTTPAQSTQ